MAKRKRKRQKSSQQDFPAWMWMLFGLAIGLSVAFAIYVNDRTPAMVEDPVPVAKDPASMREPVASSLDNNDEKTAEPEEEPRFAFYEMLPSFEVVIPEQEADVTPETKAAPAAVVEPGLYVLQAGSFSDAADADRRRAELALQGIESRVQVVKIDDKTYHRVRIGPTSDLDELNVLRSRLRQAKIDALRIRLGD